MRKRNLERENFTAHERYWANPEKARAKNRAWRKSNPQKMKAYRTAHYLLRRAFIDAAHATGCVDCGTLDLRVLQSDHIRGSKERNIADMMRKPLVRLFAELDKCEPVCANCHAIRTLERTRDLARSE